MKRLFDICNAVKHINNIFSQLTVKAYGLVIVVEGVRDRDWLIKLGFNSESIIVYNFSGFDHNIIEYRSRGYKSILILVDFDKEGRRLERLVRGRAVAHGYKELKDVRDALSRYAYFFGYTIESYIKNYLFFLDMCRRKGLV